MRPVVILDAFGRTIWTKGWRRLSAISWITTRPGTLTETIVDAASSQLPSSLITISQFQHRLHSRVLALTTTYAVDGQGRMTQMTDPNGNTSYTLYDDGRSCRV